MQQAFPQKATTVLIHLAIPPGINPDKTLKRVAFSALSVAAGKVNSGALNISMWQKMLAEKKVDVT